MAQTIWPDSEARRTFLVSMAALTDGRQPPAGARERPLLVAITLTIVFTMMAAIR